MHAGAGDRGDVDDAALRDGQLLAAGPTGETLTAERIRTLYGVDAGYPWVLASLASSDAWGVARQFALPLVVWLHACIGLHFAWRLRPWYRRWLPLLYAGALLLPVAGLAGADIPLGGRIVAVAEAFESMTRATPYRPARPVDAALAEIEACAGSQFDPTIAHIFVEEYRQNRERLSAPGRP